MKIINILIFIIGIACLNTYSLASSNNNNNCYVDAGARYNIDPTLLYSIAEQESSLNPNAINAANTNGTTDYGLMQINTIWLKHIKKFGASKNDLFDACYNIHIGAWVLHQSFQYWGYNWNGVGAYNAGNGKSAKRQRLRNKYASKVRKKYEKNCRKFGCYGNLYWSIQ